MPGCDQQPSARDHLKSRLKDSSDDSYWYSSWYLDPSYLFDQNDYSNYVSTWDFSLVFFFITNNSNEV